MCLVERDDLVQVISQCIAEVRRTRHEPSEDRSFEHADLIESTADHSATEIRRLNRLSRGSTLDGENRKRAIEAALTTQSVELHQVLTVWGDDSNCVDITIKNLGSSRTAPFTYDFTINGWYVTQSYKQNNPIRPGRSIVLFCCADGMALTSCEMNGYPYYITPDDIWPD